jgi:protein gp37
MPQQHTDMPDELTPEEREERDRHVDAVRAAQGKEYEAKLEQGRHLREITRLRLYREGGQTFEEFCENWFGFTDGRGYQLIRVADAHDQLLGADEEPLRRVSHVEAVYPLVGTEALIDVVRRGRAAAEAEGTLFVARHLTEARDRARFAPACAGGPGAAADDAWPWSAAARRRFEEVPEVDRAAVREVLVHAAALGEVTGGTVEEAAEAVAAQRAEDGRSGRPVVVGAAVFIVERNRRLLLGERPAVQRDIGYVDEAPRHPLLVVIPRGLCPDRLLDAHPGAREASAGADEVVVELAELERYGGPVTDGVLDVAAVRRAAREAGIRKTFNQTGKLIGWARYSTNPLTGCSHGCSRQFCYASDVALLYYPQAFVPTIHPARLDAFANTTLPDGAAVCPHAPGWARSVFLGSMGDLMNVSFPDWWIQAVIDEVRAHPEWTVFFLTKLARRLADFEWPPNAAVGVTVTGQREVRAAAAGLAAVRGGAFKWISAEPFLGPVDPALLLAAGATFFAAGGRSRTRWSGEFQPDPAWVTTLISAVWAHGGVVFPKDNLDFRGHIPFPEGRPPAADE